MIETGISSVRKTFAASNVAQLLTIDQNGIQEADGSIPFSSTTSLEVPKPPSAAFLHDCSRGDVSAAASKGAASPHRRSERPGRRVADESYGPSRFALRVARA